VSTTVLSTALTYGFQGSLDIPEDAGSGVHTCWVCAANGFKKILFVLRSEDMNNVLQYVTKDNSSRVYCTWMDFVLERVVPFKVLDGASMSRSWLDGSSLI